MGLTGSAHCAGMCGPIALIMPFQAFGGWKKLAALGLYHFGRISVYAGMAVVLHSFRSLFQPAIQQYISIAMGIILLGAGILTFISQHNFHVSLPWDGYVKKQLGSVMGKPGLGAIAIAGILNGLLPCGLVYMALSASVALHTATQAAGMLYLFGLGTIPMLVSISLLKSKINLRSSLNVKKFAPVVVFALGCLFVIRGLNLGIPYLSPKVAVNQHGIMHSCCHKK